MKTKAVKVSRCRYCQKFVMKSGMWGQPESWKCIDCDQEVCIWCYTEHTYKEHHDVYYAPYEHPNCKICKRSDEGNNESPPANIPGSSGGDGVDVLTDPGKR